nr:E3 ubiquitin-protein ligase At3g02290-like [Ipomoea batatas]
MGSAYSCFGASINATSDAASESRNSNCCLNLMTKVQALFCGLGTQSRLRANRYQSVTSSNNPEVIPNNNNPSLRSSNNQEVEVAKLNATKRIVQAAHEELTGKTERIILEVEPKKPLLTFDVVQCSVPSSNDDIEDVCPTCLEEYTFENPKIITKCSHHFHLSCIFEWQERSETCPVCGAVRCSLNLFLFLLICDALICISHVFGFFLIYHSTYEQLLVG